MTNLLAKSRLAFDLAVLLLICTTAALALDFPMDARWFPLYVGVAGTVLALVNLLLDMREYRTSGGRIVGYDLEVGLRTRNVSAAEVPSDVVQEDDGSDAEPADTSPAVWGVILIGYLVLIGVCGYIVATAIWLPAFLRFKAGRGGLFSVTATLVTVCLLLALHKYLSVAFPGSLLFELRKLWFGDLLV